MKLHYSQTGTHLGGEILKLNYHMKLHYSQTCLAWSVFRGALNYHMKLHYSQTGGLVEIMADSLTTI